MINLPRFRSLPGRHPSPSTCQSASYHISKDNQHYIDVLRGLSIIRVLLAHLGLSWFFPPYSQYISVLFPLLFFVSGAVSFYSYCRSEGVREYAIKRFVLILVPFYFFGLTIGLIDFLFVGGTVGNGADLLRWVLTWPNRGKVFFPIGHIWFINALIVMIAVTIPLFAIAKRHPSVLWIGVIAPFLFSLANFFLAFYSDFISQNALVYFQYGSQSWQILTLLCAFCAGALHFRLYQDLHPLSCLAVALAFLLVAGFFLCAGSFELDLTTHIKQRSVYFLSLSFFGIYLLLSLRPMVNWLLKKFPFIRAIILYANKYAYAIFLFHTLVLFCVERGLGLSGLGGRPALAVLRLIIVVFLTFIVAKPLGDLSAFIAKRIRAFMLSTKEPENKNA